MYVILLSCTGLILQFLPPVALLSSPGPLTREVGQHVVFMVDGTEMLEATWGVRKANTEYLNPRLIKVFNPGSANPDSQLDTTSYAGRVSFVGDLSKGQAWFKITNLNLNDTKEYMMKILLKTDSSSYRNIPIQLIVIHPVSTTPPIQTTTREITTEASFSQTSPRATTSPALQLSNQSMLIKVVKRASGDLSDPNSTAFQRFTENFVSEIQTAYRNIDNFEKAKVTSLSENSIPVKFVIFFKKAIKPDEACAPLEDAMKDNRLGSLKIVPGSLGCSSAPSSSSPKNQSSSYTCSRISIIAACVAIIIFLILVVVVLLIYIWRLKSKLGKAVERRMSSSTQDKKLGDHENAQPMKETRAPVMASQTTRTPNTEKELYETITNENKGTAAITANIKPNRGPPVGDQGDVPSLQQHYQELQTMTPNPTPLYEPLKQSKFSNKQQLTSDVPKTYEQLKQSASGREYQSLKSYKADSESKV